MRIVGNKFTTTSRKKIIQGAPQPIFGKQFLQVILVLLFSLFLTYYSFPKMNYDGAMSKSGFKKIENISLSLADTNNNPVSWIDVHLTQDELDEGIVAHNFDPGEPMFTIPDGWQCRLHPDCPRVECYYLNWKNSIYVRGSRPCIIAFLKMEKFEKKKELEKKTVMNQ